MPLFTTPNVNHYWAVETDDYLKIRRFTPYTRDSQGVVHLDASDRMALFRKGDYAPIPVWIRGDTLVFPGGIGREDVELDLPEQARSRPVVKRLLGILARARRKEIVATSEIEDFWHSFRFLSQNFSAGSAWLRKLGAVSRQAEAFFRPGSLELDDLRELVWRWIGAYIGRVSVDRFEEFLATVMAVPMDLLDRDLVLSMALLERLLTGGQKRRSLEVSNRLGAPSPQEARARLSHASLNQGPITRFAFTFENKLVAEVQRCFEKVDRDDLLGHFEALDDFVVLVGLFGPVPLPNWITYTIPKVIKSYFDIMKSMEGDIRAARSEDAPAEEIAGLQEDFDAYLEITEAFARMVGGDHGVEVMRQAYAKRTD